MAGLKLFCVLHIFTGETGATFWVFFSSKETRTDMILGAFRDTTRESVYPLTLYIFYFWHLGKARMEDGRWLDGPIPGHRRDVLLIGLFISI